MASEYEASLRPRDFMRTNGPLTTNDLGATGIYAGLRLLKSDVTGFTALIRLTSTAVGTGLTFKLLIVDDGKDSSDLGKVVRLAVAVKLIATGTDDLTATGIGTEVEASGTLDATTGQAVEVSIALTQAEADAIAALGWGLVRVRRIGTAATDTCLGTVLLLGCEIINT
jgi:hypothetical protein